MIVYGDPSTTLPAAQVLDGIRRKWSALQGKGTWSEDELRALLVQCGQVEQAVQDWLAAHPDHRGRGEIGACVQSVTDAVARVYLLARATHSNYLDLQPQLESARRDLSRLQLPSWAELNVKLPEGPAFYALLPDQYAEAALRWHFAQERDSGPVLVVGVRSAGTAFSAVVAAELSRLGCPVRRMTVRPTGPPFCRELELSKPAVRGIHSALVVDEGPGLSGSTMAAVAEALVRSGVPAERIAFLPGHSGEPGSAASAAVREWWRRVPRFHVPLDELCWPEGHLRHLLGRATEEFLPGSGPVVRSDDVSWGLWRAHRFSRQEDWPAAALPFERTKYRYQLADGRQVLWKFEGLAVAGEGQRTGTERALEQWTALSQRGWTPAPLGACCGFVAVPWVEGSPGALVDRSPELIRQVGAYVADCAGPPMSADELKAAQVRLREMLYWNTWEVLGEEPAARIARWADRVPPASAEEPTYGDGRLAPWEWLREPDGRLVKVDAAGHEYDHTAVGVQSVLWDLAGALVEWDLGPGEEAQLLAAYRSRVGGEVHQERLALHRAGYLAHRMGLMHLCAGAAPDEAERARAQAAFERYRAEMARTLEAV